MLVEHQSGQKHGQKHVVEVQRCSAEPVFRMVLVGKTGTGKSTAGNTILGRRAFEDSLGSSSVTTKCQKEMAKFNGQTLPVVDTPGLFDTRRPEEEVKREIARCISLSAPGSHVFLVVIQPMFGEKSREYMMVLFTHGDQLKRNKVSIEKMISGNKDLSGFISQCGGGYHVFNNETKNRSQVRELLKKINMMVQRNGGSFYTNEMLEEAERVIQESMERPLRGNPGMTPEEARRQAEDEITKEVEKGFAWVAGFGTAGAAIRALGGPVGAMMGGIVSLVENNDCIIQ
uniref:AIG1-type G domain-containing protein n=1 Tax=Amphiprion percula TaxID=161767 RepID=A0A3P8RXQ9_AMPPE